MGEQPIEEGDIIEIEITSIGRKGDGVGKVDDFVIVVPRSKLNKKYVVKITDVYETYAFGIIEG